MQNHPASYIKKASNNKLKFFHSSYLPNISINTPTLLKTVTVTSLMLLSACSTVSVRYNTPQQAIEKQRGNIVSTNHLSSQTQSTLTSMGINPNDCVDNFDRCISNFKKTVINANKESLAMYAELHMAKAKSIADNELCQNQLIRPPINPYYANAQLPPEEQHEVNQRFAQCNNDYRYHLLSAIKNSYAFLFYDQLDKTASERAYNPTVAGHLTTNLEVQTKDVYEASSNDLIRHLYNNRSRREMVDAVTPYIDTSSLKDVEQIKRYSNSEKLVKLLNFKFEPVAPGETPRLYEQEDGPKRHGFSAQEDNTQKDEDNDKPKKVDLTPTSIDVYLPDDPIYLQNTQKHNDTFDELYTSHRLDFDGLNTLSQRDGLGVSYVASFNNRINTSIKSLLQTQGKKLNSPNVEDRIHMTGNLLLTGVVAPKGSSVLDILDTHDFDIKLYNPYHSKTVDIEGVPYRLAANFSASYGMWLAENRLSNVGYFSMLSRQQSLQLPQLFMLEPYDPNKRIIIMLHGLASSPATWVSVTNDISNDTELRESFQVWQIFYPTNIPIIENRYRIQQLIEAAYEMNDPQGNDIASQHSVLIGHSMGAVIGRMLLSNDNLEPKLQELAQSEGNNEIDKVINTQLNKQNIVNRLHLNRLDSVDTAVFISAPFRGTDFADQWFTRALRRIVQLPLGFAQTLKGNLASIATEGELLANPLGGLYLQNGASQLSDKSSFMKLTADLKMADDVTYHTIIANRDSDILDGLMRLNITSAPSTQLASDVTKDEIQDKAESAPDLGLEDDSLNSSSTNRNLGSALGTSLARTLSPNVSDGIVPYSSAHLDGAASETILSGTHGIHETPEAVLTLRKILHKQLLAYPINNQTDSAKP